MLVVVNVIIDWKMLLLTWDKFRISNNNTTTQQKISIVIKVEFGCIVTGGADCCLGARFVSKKFKNI